MTLQYWIDLEECICASELPIGGCLKCDLITFSSLQDRLIAALEHALKNNIICPFCGRNNAGYAGGCTSDDCPGVELLKETKELR